MNCRNFKDLLDSYLCEELAIETNHQMLDHAEHCPPCRAEMASRRNFRAILRRACSQDQMSEKACERLRARLQTEAAAGMVNFSDGGAGWRERWARFFTFRFAVPAAGLAAILVFAAAGVLTYLKSQTHTVPPPATLLSDALMTEAANDHRRCAPHFIPAVGPMEMPESVKTVDAAYFGLEKVAAAGAIGLQLHSAHMCRFEERRFAHLVYTRGDHLISLLVTTRDNRALKTGELSTSVLDSTALQEAIRNEFALGAYQTSKHVILVVSDFPETENEALTRDLAMPVVEHLSRLDNQSVFNLHTIQLQDLIANFRGGRLR